MFKMGGEIYTAATTGTVLPGITRMSCIELLKSWGYKVNEGKLAIDTVMEAGRDGSLEEVFGTGTAAVISPVGSLMYEQEVVTPMLQGSILPGITRKSAIDVCKSWGLKVSERRISIQEISDAYDAGKLQEVFGTGTAAVISPVGILKWGDKVMEINGNKIGDISQKLYDTMTGIQWGKIEDTFNWTVEVK
jgi:branched-subunit amino acid aminotransferase/4-amino-4-deoxychorismate lyase